MLTSAENARKQDREGFAQRLIEVRREANLSQVEAGELSGVGGNMIWKWEKGSTFPRAASIKKLADAFDVEAKWLLTGEGPKKKQKDAPDAAVIETVNGPKVVEPAKTVEPVKTVEPIEQLPKRTVIVYTAEDTRNLSAIEETIKALKYLDMDMEKKRRIHKLLSDMRADYESRVLFGTRANKYY